MNQLSLLDEIPEKTPWLHDEIAYTLSFDQDKIIKDIIRLYNIGQAFDVDCTYSKGVFWRNLPAPRLKFDIAPQSKDVVEASADDLPLEDGSVHSVMFDPPFMPTKSRNNPGKIKARFTSFNSVVEMWDFYERATHEIYRVLMPGGILAFKCQDTISSGKPYFTHTEVERYARTAGFDMVDLFVLGNRRVMMSSLWKTQVHARKNHSFMYVFEKPLPAKEKK